MVIMRADTGPETTGPRCDLGRPPHTSLSFLVCGRGIIIVPVSQSRVRVKQDTVYKKLHTAPRTLLALKK